MPNNKAHADHSFKRYGVRGEDVHSWLDEPCKLFGGEHRKLRHGFETINEAVKVFGLKYGDETVRNIVTDHWTLDSKEDKIKSTTDVEELGLMIFNEILKYESQEKIDKRLNEIMAQEGLNSIDEAKDVWVKRLSESMRRNNDV